VSNWPSIVQTTSSSSAAGNAQAGVGGATNNASEGTRIPFRGSAEGIERETEFRRRGYEEGRRLGCIGGGLQEYLSYPITTDREAAFMLGLVEGFDETMGNPC
jgi:hypothetical protein